MPVYRLSESDIWFPPPEEAEEDGLLAVGGGLEPQRLLLAYANGIFPWFDPGDEILWWCPHERFIISPPEIHISSSMKKFLRRTDIEIRFNRDFSDTMHRCRLKRENAEGTWISDEMEQAYAALHRAGFAVSVEAFFNGQLAGGLYGVVIGSAFFGESMFSELENGSKAALIGLAHQLEELGGPLIDCQFHTDHLQSMGGKYISWAEYSSLLDRCLGSTGLRGVRDCDQEEE